MTTPVFSEEDDAFLLANYRPGKVCGADTRPGLTSKQIAEHLGRNRASVITRYHILMGHRGKGGVFKREVKITKDTKETVTPSLFRTKFEDLDPGKYDD